MRSLIWSKRSAKTLSSLAMLARSTTSAGSCTSQPSTTTSRTRMASLHAYPLPAITTSSKNSTR